MIKLIRCPIVGLKLPIITAFKNDKLMLEKYHIKGGTLEDCVNDTFDKINEAQQHLPLQAYVINKDGICIGFTVICKQYNILYSFGIAKKYRVKSILFDWFNIIVDTLKNFVCYLWNKNNRAISFMVKMGMQITKVEKEFTCLKYE